MDSKINGIWHFINLLVAGFALVGAMSDYSGRDFDLPKYFHELPDVRLWQKDRGIANVLICSGLHYQPYSGLLC